MKPRQPTLPGLPMVTEPPPAPPSSAPAGPRRPSELAALREIGATLATQRDLGACLEAIAGIVLRVLRTDHVQITLWDETSQSMRYAAVVEREPEAATLPASRRMQPPAALTRQPVIAHRAPDGSPNDLPASMTVPVLFQTRLLGVLHTRSADPGERFTPEDLRFAQMAALHAAIAVEQAHLQDLVSRQAAELEAQVHERTRELEAANLDLQQTARWKSELLADMSHEIRTPINCIIGFADLLQTGAAGALTENQTRYLARIRGSAGLLVQLVADILDLCKTEAQQLTLHPECFAVREIIQNILVIARGLAIQKSQRLHTTIAANLPPLHADPLRFKQILFNLLSNAVKFTGERGHITLTAGLRTEPIFEPFGGPAEDQGPFLELCIQDTGVGIKPEDLPRLFTPFVQTDTTRAQNHDGTGLGLALTKHLVELHGGRITAASEGEGKGSTFTVVLPLGGQATAAAQTPPGGVVSPQPPGPTGPAALAA